MSGSWNMAKQLLPTPRIAKSNRCPTCQFQLAFQFFQQIGSIWKLSFFFVELRMTKKATVQVSKCGRAGLEPLHKCKRCSDLCKHGKVSWEPHPAIHIPFTYQFYRGAGIRQHITYHIISPRSLLGFPSPLFTPNFVPRHHCHLVPPSGSHVKQITGKVYHKVIRSHEFQGYMFVNVAAASFKFTLERIVDK